MRGDYVDKGIKVDELEGDEYADQREVVSGAEPTQMEYLVQNDAALDQN